MKHLATAPESPLVRRSRRASVVLIAAAFALLPFAASGPSAPVASAATGGTDSAVTVQGDSTFPGLEVTVDQTRDLTNQAVTINWSGAAPTNQTSSGIVLANFLQFMQCWAEPGQQPTREQCQFGGFLLVPNGGDGVNIASRQATQFVVDPLETTYVRDPAKPFEPVFVGFDSIDGTQELTQQSQFFDASSTNEIPIGRTAADGTGQVFFEMQTGLEAPGLGCGQVINGRSPDCYLVVVPRNSTEVDGSTVGTRSDDWMVSSPLSASNWQHRMVVPLQFQPIGASCSFGRPETPTAGTDLVTEAITSWQPELCGLGPRNVSFTSLTDDTTRQVLASDEPGLAFVNRSVDGLTGAVYAPVAVSALTVVANIDLPLPSRDSQGKPVNADNLPADVLAKVGLRVPEVNLTPRLLAKLLTQSYQFDKALGTATNIGGNPFDISRDPDFLAVNPAFQPSGYLAYASQGLGRMLVTSTLSDSADLVWRYLLSDKEARDFLAGKPDPWGMVLNEKYKGLALPTSAFPRADLGCQLPAARPSNWDLENCTLNIAPYGDSFGSIARQASRGETGRRSILKPGLVNTFGLEPNQSLGQQAMLGLTATAAATRYSDVKVALRNAAGKFVAPDAQGMAAAVGAMKADDQGLLTTNLATTEADAYPLTVVTYAATVPSNLTAEQRQDYSGVLGYVASSGQVQGTAPGQLPPGYLPLPAKLRSQTAAAAAKLASYTPSPSPTPTVAEPTPTPSDPGGDTVTATPQPTFATDTGGTETLPSSGGASPTPSESAAPTESPSSTPVASVGITPADSASASRLALAAALLLGLSALFLRTLLPWIASRRT